MSINSYLANLQNELYVNGTEREKIRKSIDTISSRLNMYFGRGKNCEHKIVKKEIFGSYSRDTMLSRRYDEKSDVDYMIIFEDANQFTPQTCLNWLKGFAEYWYSTSIVKQSLPTIVIELENIKFELVPAYETLWGTKYIALDSSSWQYTNPKELNDKMLDVNNDTLYEFKRMVRIMKYWNIKKNYRKYSSYELETFLTDKFQYSYSNCKSSFDYLDWAFYFIGQYKYIDQYVTSRIEKVKECIQSAKGYENSGFSSLAEEQIMKIFE